MLWKNFSTLVVFIFFLFSLFYGVKNLYLSKNSYKVIQNYKISIENLKKLLGKEKEENIKLRQTLEYINSNPKTALELFIRDYLQMVKRDEGVLKP